MSNSNSTSSRKEQEVIAQQRKLAALLAKRSTSHSLGERPHERPQEREPSTASDTHKRPSRPERGRAKHASASAVLAAARAKAAAKKDPPVLAQKREATVLDSSTNCKETATATGTATGTGTGTGTVQRKPSTAVSSRLANLVKSISTAPTGDEVMPSAAFGSNITPADFWKNIREWDFVSDLANLNNEDDKDETPMSARKAIPETFISFRHYISLWAPLCLAETRAQLLSELMTSSNQLGSKANLFLEVQVETTWKTGGRNDRNLHSDLMDMDSCSVKLGTKERNKGAGQFFPNDVFCLIPVEYKDAIELLLNGKKVTNKDGSFKRFCLVGHTEVQRKDVNGLILKVSKRKWAQIGTSNMYLLKIGANITALREFTALCTVEAIPLKRYLLGHHLTGKSKQDAPSLASVAPPSDPSHIRKDLLLKQMGGVQALGKGFTDYAQKKFNPSQLLAISASSTGYGEGEFAHCVDWSLKKFTPLT
jgi:hypothetical protein